MRAVVADPRRQVVKRLAGVRPFDCCGLTLGVTKIVLGVLVGDEVDGLLSVNAVLSKG